MILEALNDYYARLLDDPESQVAPEGFENKRLEFLIVIDYDGKFINVEDLREMKNKTLIGKNYLLPKSTSRSGAKSYETVFLLWDKKEYVLGLPKDNQSSQKYLDSWLKMLSELPDEFQSEKEIIAIRKFYENGELSKALNSEVILDIEKAVSANMAFKLYDQLQPVPCLDYVRSYISAQVGDATDESESTIYGRCIVTGRYGKIARIHTQTPISKDSKVLVGFQKNSGYDSYGKEQAYNAPTIESTEFAYTTALNYLLKSANQKLRVGDMTMVFWSEQKTQLEAYLHDLFYGIPKEIDESKKGSILKLYQSIYSGKYMEEESDTRFYTLGLSPSSARISVRLWNCMTVGEMANNIRQYFNDFAIVKPHWEPEYYSVNKILKSIVLLEKEENIPPRLAGDFMSAIVKGTAYPASLMQLALIRVKADQEKRVTPERAAVIKAYLNRYGRLNNPIKYKEVSMSLNIHHESPAYHLGRLFAVFEKVQEESRDSRGNTTIRDRYYGAASSSPVTVFTNLVKLSNHHLAKIDNQGRVINFNKLIGEIMTHVDKFPAQLNLHEQGYFAIGYYHQRSDLFTSQAVEEENTEN